jgi:ribose transport system permease protein
MTRWFGNYGMVGVLAVLCAYYSWATLTPQQQVGEQAGRELADQIAASGQKSHVLVVASAQAEDVQFTTGLRERLTALDVPVAGVVNGEPTAVRATIARLQAQGAAIDVVATTRPYRLVVNSVRRALSALPNARVEILKSYYWPTFLLADNLLNVANQIVVIAVIAVGMTMVIITGGIDLSVGSLVALSAVITGTLIVRGGGLEAGSGAMLLACLGAVAACAAVGGFSGLMITRFQVPPFIATLAMMQVASGLAFKVSHGGSIYLIPTRFTWLGLGADLWSIPNAVLLMIGVYLLAHVVMTYTRLGRYLYAVGGNRQAARLSGLRVNRVLLVAYIASGAMAGLGGVIEASRLKAGAPTYGGMYELYVIAAVVIGGTSLAGGEGKVLGTLVGAFIIATIQNGMNLTGVEHDTQKVVLGLVILGAVLLDVIKKQGWRILTQTV